MTSPLWLTEAGASHLLNYLLDKLDAADVQGRPLVRAIRLDAKSFPALYKATLEEERERLWGQVKQLVAWGWLELKLDKLKPGQAEYESNPRVTIKNEEKLRLVTGRLERARSAGELWREAVYGLPGLDTPLKEAISRMRLEVPGRTADAVAKQLALLPTMVSEPLLLREVSARLFWGLSKVLDGRQQLVATMLQAEECPFPEMPVQLQVFLPDGGFTGVLLIENLATFEQATRAGASRYENLALVFVAGFKGSARRLRSATGASVYFASHGSVDAKYVNKFLVWLRAGASMPCWFWGDLDYAGMRILAALRETFNDITAWEPGYAPMLELLLSEQGHPPESAFKSGQQAIATTGCSYADLKLIPAMVQTGDFVDQEIG